MAVTSDKIAAVTRVLRRHGATRIVLFGSALESPETARDVDIAVDGIQGWAIFRAGAEAEKILGMPLDLVPLSPPTRFTRYIEKKGRVVYERG